MSQSDSIDTHLSQRQMRNESGRVWRAVAEGQTFVLTNRGTPVGKIVPLHTTVPKLPIVRRARRVGQWTSLGIVRKTISRPLQDALDALREERV